MKRYFKMIFAAALIGFSTSANAIDRHSLAQYAASLKGLKKEQLKAALYDIIREFGIRKGLKKLVISSKIRIFIGENQ